MTGLIPDPKRVVFQQKQASEYMVGEVRIEQYGSGYYIYVTGANLDDQGREMPVAMIDLFQQSRAAGEGYYQPGEPRPVAQIMVFDGDDEFVMTRHFDHFAIAQLTPGTRYLPTSMSGREPLQEIQRDAPWGVYGSHWGLQRLSALWAQGRAAPAALEAPGGNPDDQS